MENQLGLFDHQPVAPISEFAVQIIPQPPLYMEIQQYKKRFLEEYGRVKYLTTQPHISMVSFPARRALADKVVANLCGILKQTAPILLQTRGFTSYHNKKNNTHTLVLSIQTSKEVLEVCREVINYSVNQLLLKKKTISSTSSLHLTIGSEISEGVIKKALQAFQQDYKVTQWTVDKIRVLQRDHLKGPWEKHWDIALNC